MSKEQKLSRSEDLMLRHGLTANVEVERFVLGGIMISPDSNQATIQLLDTSDFAHESHRRIFHRMVDLVAEGRTVDRVTVANELLRFQQLETVGGLTYLISLDDGLPQIHNLDSYVQILKRHSLIRRTMVALEAGMEELAHPSADSKTVDRVVASVVNATTATRLDKSLKNISEIIEDAGGLNAILAPPANQVPLFLPSINAFTGGGFQPGELVILGAFPGIGKTAFALQQAAFMAAQGHRVDFFTLEMGRESLVKRLLSSGAPVDNLKLRAGQADHHDRFRILNYLRSMIDQPIYFNDENNISPARIIQLCKRTQPKLIVIDYVGLLSAGGNQFRTRADEVTYLGSALKKAAAELDTVIILLSQLKTPKTPGAEPSYFDLAESSGLNRDADWIGLLYARTSADGTHQTIFKLDKARHGKTGKVQMDFVKQYLKFSEIGSGEV